MIYWLKRYGRQNRSAKIRNTIQDSHSGKNRHHQATPDSRRVVMLNGKDEAADFLESKTVRRRG